MHKANSSNNFYYNKELNPLAKELKKQMTKSEACMWKYLLQAKQFYGYKFRRQRPILNYIVDFCCLELMLIIEVDGFTHDSEDAVSKDIERDLKLVEIGFSVLRFSSWEVLNRIAEVNIILSNWLIENKIKSEIIFPPPTPS